jgi:hypothetical protein
MGVVMPRMFGTKAAMVILDEQPECKIFLFSRWKGPVPYLKTCNNAAMFSGLMAKPYILKTS